MPRSIYVYLLLFNIFFFNNSAFSQSKKEDSLAVFYSEDFKEALPPLESLINIALKNSLYMKYNEALIDKSKAGLILTKREWTNNISAVGNYSLGNQRYVVASSGGDFQNTFLDGYRTGLNVALPLSLITNRGVRIRSAEADYKASQIQLKQTELDLKSRVIKDYYDLIAANNILKIKSMSKDNAEIQNDIAEKSFAEGSISLEDYTIVSRSVSGSFTDYELAKSDFLTKYKQFEQLLGVSLFNLRSRK